MTDNPRQLLNSLQFKMEKLMYYCDLLKDENSKLKHRLDQESAYTTELRSELEIMQTKYKNLKTAQGLAPDAANTEEAKARFERLVREIDKCISLLNQ